MYIYYISLYACVHTTYILAQFAFDWNRKNLLPRLPMKKKKNSQWLKEKWTFVMIHQQSLRQPIIFVKRKNNANKNLESNLKKNELCLWLPTENVSCLNDWAYNPNRTAAGKMDSKQKLTTILSWWIYLSTTV